MKHAHLAFASRRPAAQALAAVVAMTVATASLGAPDRHLEHADRHHRGGAGEAEHDAADGRVGLDGPDPHARRGRVGRPASASIGYKSSQCNALYYNPATNYKLPQATPTTTRSRRSASTPRRTPATAPTTRFPTARRATCATQFIAYDEHDARHPDRLSRLPGPGYYYVYTGPEALGYTSAPCRQSTPGQRRSRPRAAAPGPATTSRPSRSAQQTNFAIWYSFYRTRLALTKSAASLAFAPLNDTRRVGFITVEPKDTCRRRRRSTRSATCRSATSMRSRRQVVQQGVLAGSRGRLAGARGPGPGRPLLRRPGRRHQHRHAGHGRDDPIQYACQQNFTIMTTDGYWNGHTETPGGGGGDARRRDQGRPAGRHPAGGPRHLPRDRSVLQAADVGRRLRHGPYRHRQDQRLHRQRVRHQRQVPFDVPEPAADLADDTRLEPYREADDPVPAGDAPGRRDDDADHQDRDPDVQTTTQYALRMEHFDEERYQHVKWQEQTTKVTEQYELQTTQTVAQSFQTREVKSQVFKDEDQYTTATVAIRGRDDAVREADRPVHPESQPEDRPSVPDDRLQLERRARHRRSTATACRAPATGRSNASSRSSPARPRRSTPSAVRSLPPSCVGESGDARQDDLHRRPVGDGRAAGCDLRSRVRSGDLRQRLGRDPVRPQRRLAGRAVQRHLCRDHPRPVPELLHLHLHPAAGQQPDESGGVMRGRPAHDRSGHVRHHDLQQARSARPTRPRPRRRRAPPARRPIPSRS